MTDWEKWRSLLMTARYGSYARAAAAIDIDATTMGRRIKTLETSLGFELFFRDEGRLRPTPRCETLLHHIETADDALRDAANFSASTNSENVWREARVSAPPFLLGSVFAPEINSLAEKRNINVELMATSSNGVLTRREADISVRIEDRPSVFRVNYERIQPERLGVLTYVVAAARSSAKSTLPWAGVFDAPYVTTGTRKMKSLAGSDRIRFQTQHFSTVAEIVAAGAARALLPSVLVRRDDRLTAISDTVLTQPLWMLFHKQDVGVPHLRAVRDWILATTAAALDEGLVGNAE